MFRYHLMNLEVNQENFIKKVLIKIIIQQQECQFLINLYKLNKTTQTYILKYIWLFKITLNKTYKIKSCMVRQNKMKNQKVLHNTLNNKLNYIKQLLNKISQYYLINI